MQYMLLIYRAESAEPLPETPEFGTLMQGYMDFTQEIEKNGVMVEGNALEQVVTSTTVKVRNGKTETIDGPFAETKEQFGGYYILDCKDLDEAIGYAAKIPSAVHGSIEIRPVKVFEMLEG